MRRVADGGLEALNMRGGITPPENSGRLVTNARHLMSDYWRPWLGPEYRCLVPATNVREPPDTKPNVWH